MEENKSPLSKEAMMAFHKDLNELLNKYDLQGEKDHVQIQTSKVNLFATNLTNCNPGCLAHGLHQDQFGNMVVGWYCAC